MSTDPDRQQQGQYPPPQWNSQSSRGPYPPAPSQRTTNHPSQQPHQSYHHPTTSEPGEMVTLPPPQSQQHPDMYHPAPSYDMYQGHPQHPYQPSPHDPRNDPQNAQMSFNQPAPRQRTAIACRYCRRRKIRCHGFDSSPDGRCTNCTRFHQECIFTPVSSQAHAFVPAHTAYPYLRNTGRGDGRAIYPQQGQPIIYGAHGQPLGPMPSPGQDPNYPHQPLGYGPGPYPGPVYDDRGPPPPPQDHGRLSSTNPTSSGVNTRRGSSGTGFEYPDPTHMAPVSPASSTTSYQSAPYPPPAQQQTPQPPPQPYYPPPPPQQGRRSPQSAYSYDARASGSPHGSTSSASGYPSSYPGGLHPPQVLPPTRESGRTPPPTAGQPRDGSGNGRAGMSVRDMLGPGEGAGGRSSADSDMLNALNRRGM